MDKEVIGVKTEVSANSEDSKRERLGQEGGIVSDEQAYYHSHDVFGSEENHDVSSSDPFEAVGLFSSSRFGLRSAS